MADGGLLRGSLGSDGMGRNLESRVADSAIQAAGYVLKLVNTGNVDLAGADEASYGISTKSTKEFVSDGLGGGVWTAQADVPVSIQREGEALVQVLATNVLIAIGDILQTTAGGTVDTITYAGGTPTLAELRSVVGVANQAVLANAGGVMKVILSILRI